MSVVVPPLTSNSGNSSPRYERKREGSSIEEEEEDDDEGLAMPALALPPAGGGGGLHSSASSSSSSDEIEKKKLSSPSSGGKAVAELVSSCSASACDGIRDSTTPESFCRKDSNSVAARNSNSIIVSPAKTLTISTTATASSPRYQLSRSPTPVNCPTSVYRGVYYWPPREEWRVNFTDEVSGKRRMKTFPARKLGFEDAREQAEQFACKFTSRRHRINNNFIKGAAGGDNVWLLSSSSSSSMGGGVGGLVGCTCTSPPNSPLCLPRVKSEENNTNCLAASSWRSGSHIHNNNSGSVVDLGVNNALVSQSPDACMLRPQGSCSNNSQDNNTVVGEEVKNANASNCQQQQQQQQLLVVPTAASLPSSTSSPSPSTVPSRSTSGASPLPPKRKQPSRAAKRMRSSVGQVMDENRSFPFSLEGTREALLMMNSAPLCIPLSAAAFASRDSDVHVSSSTTTGYNNDSNSFVLSGSSVVGSNGLMGSAVQQQQPAVGASSPYLTPAVELLAKHDADGTFYEDLAIIRHSQEKIAELSSLTVPVLMIATATETETETKTEPPTKTELTNSKKSLVCMNDLSDWQLAMRHMGACTSTISTAGGRTIYCNKSSNSSRQAEGNIVQVHQMSNPTNDTTMISNSSSIFKRYDDKTRANNNTATISSSSSSIPVIKAQLKTKIDRLRSLPMHVDVSAVPNSSTTNPNNNNSSKEKLSSTDIRQHETTPFSSSNTNVLYQQQHCFHHQKNGDNISASSSLSSACVMGMRKLGGCTSPVEPLLRVLEQASSSSIPPVLLSGGGGSVNSNNSVLNNLNQQQQHASSSNPLPLLSTGPPTQHIQGLNNGGMNAIIASNSASSSQHQRPSPLDALKKKATTKKRRSSAVAPEIGQGSFSRVYWNGRANSWAVGYYNGRFRKFWYFNDKNDAGAFRMLSLRGEHLQELLSGPNKGGPVDSLEDLGYHFLNSSVVAEYVATDPEPPITPPPRPEKSKEKNPFANAVWQARTGMPHRLSPVLQSLARGGKFPSGSFSSSALQRTIASLLAANVAEGSTATTTSSATTSGASTQHHSLPTKPKKKKQRKTIGTGTTIDSTISNNIATPTGTCPIIAPGMSSSDPLVISGNLSSSVCSLSAGDMSNACLPINDSIAKNTGGAFVLPPYPHVMPSSSTTVTTSCLPPTAGKPLSLMMTSSTMIMSSSPNNHSKNIVLPSSSASCGTETTTNSASSNNVTPCFLNHHQGNGGDTTSSARENKCDFPIIRWGTLGSKINWTPQRRRVFDASEEATKQDGETIQTERQDRGGGVVTSSKTHVRGGDPDSTP